MVNVSSPPFSCCPQQELSKKSATKNAQAAANTLQGEAERLQKAEQSMQVQLDKVELERSQVEKAVADLEQTNTELDRDFMLKLKRGGLPKQASLVGFVLFSVRSILDSVVAVTSNDPSHLSSALIQGGVAIICAIAFFFLV